MTHLQTFSLYAQDGVEICSYQWEQQQNHKGVVLILHGMAEYALRYDEFARVLSSDGYIVYACDHRGHGKTGQKMGKLGFFAIKNGWSAVTQDIFMIIAYIKNLHPDKELFIFGHSMGSYLARTCMAVSDIPFSGVILSGTSLENLVVMRLALRLSKVLCSLRGADQDSPLLSYLTFGSFNKHFRPAETPYDWLSRDKNKVNEYNHDPLCGFTCTHGFYRDLFTGLIRIHQFQSLHELQSKPPLLLLAGSRDPVSHMGKDIQPLADIYEHCGFPRVQYKLYHKARHEVLNETNKQEVMTDILSWLNDQC